MYAMILSPQALAAPAQAKEQLRQGHSYRIASQQGCGRHIFKSLSPASIPCLCIAFHLSHQATIGKGLAVRWSGMFQIKAQTKFQVLMKHRGPFVCVWYGGRGTCCEARPIFQGDWLKLLGWEPPRSVRRLSSRARPVSWMTERAAGLLWLPARRCRRPRLVVASLASAGEGNSPARSKASFIACICTVDSSQAPCYVYPDP